MEPLTVGIIGGLGRMGAWFARIFSRAGYRVLISDLGTPLTNREVARTARVVLVSVPLEVFPEVVKEIAPVLSRDSGLIDLCSLKARQVQAMLEHTVCEVVGAHPLFGPYEKDLAGQTVALCPARGEHWYRWFKTFLEEQGARTVTVSPEEHDRLMALVQVLNHFWLMVLGEVLSESGLDLEKVVALSTPSFRHQLEILARLALQDADLYAAIQFDNPLGDEVRELFWRSARRLSEMITRGERKAYVREFERVKALARKIGALLGSLPAEEEEPDSHQKHEHTEELPPGHPSPEKTHSRVRFPEEFQAETDTSVEHQKEGQFEPLGPPSPAQGKEDQE